MSPLFQPNCKHGMSVLTGGIYSPHVLDFMETFIPFTYVLSLWMVPAVNGQPYALYVLATGVANEPFLIHDFLVDHNFPTFLLTVPSIKRMTVSYLCIYTEQMNQVLLQPTLYNSKSVFTTDLLCIPYLLLLTPLLLHVVNRFYSPQEKDHHHERYHGRYCNIN